MFLIACWQEVKLEFWLQSQSIFVYIMRNMAFKKEKEKT